MFLSQINVKSVEDLDVIHEELLGVPLLLRVWAELQQNNNFTGDSNLEQPRWESKLDVFGIHYSMILWINKNRYYTYKVLPIGGRTNMYTTSRYPSTLQLNTLFRY